MLNCSDVSYTLSSLLKPVSPVVIALDFAGSRGLGAPSLIGTAVSNETKMKVTW